MVTHRRKADGRRVFTPQFKQEQIARLSRQELTVAELARELAVAPQLLRQWQRLSTDGSAAAVAANEAVVPASELRAAEQRIRELERALGKKVMEIEILQAARDEVKKKTALLHRVHAVTGRKMAVICRVLGISRACAYRTSAGRPRRYAKATDRVVTAQVRTIIRTRASYGARRVHALVNQRFATGYNVKRIQRVMALQGWTLSPVIHRRTGRAHRGRIQRDMSNERWCSDGLEIACWNGELVQVAFALDCHDREVMAHVAVPRDLVAADIQQLMQDAVAARFGPGRRPPTPIQWLSDNGSIYTALATQLMAERLHLVPITTPAASPQSNGMAEAFVHTLRRDYLAGADLATAAQVLAQLPAWMADYNGVAPHSALGYQSPQQYRHAQSLAGEISAPKVPHELGY